MEVTRWVLRKTLKIAGFAIPLRLLIAVSVDGSHPNQQALGLVDSTMFWRNERLLVPSSDGSRNCAASCIDDEMEEFWLPDGVPKA